MPKQRKIIKMLAEVLSGSRKRKRRHRSRRRSSSGSRSRSPRRTSSCEISRTPSPEADAAIHQSPEPEATAQSPIPPPEIEITDSDENNKILEALGEEYVDTKKFEGNIQTDISKRWDHLLVNGLTKEEKDAIMKKYKLPENCQLLDAPVLNEEVKTILTESAKNRDRSLELVQHQLGIATGIIGKVMSSLMEEKHVDKILLLKKLSDAAKLLNDMHYHKTKTRRLLVSPLLDKNFNNLVEKVKRDEHLYGIDLATKIKTSQEITKSSSSIKKNVIKPNKPITKPQQKTAGNQYGPPQTQPRNQTRATAPRGGPKNRVTQPPHRRPGPSQSRPERAAPRHAHSRR